jgi:prepilin-type N-terminal cleavage/methylation domain-containing protein
MLTNPSLQKPARGFSLIELMVSVTIGLIVAAGAVTLIVAIDRSNTEMIQSTRLTQELRALASVISDDVKRTRRIDDPIAMVGQGSTNTCPTVSATKPATPSQPCYAIGTTLPVSGVDTCLYYGYTGTTSNGSIYNYRAVRLSNSNLILDQGAYDPSAVATGTRIPVVTGCSASGIVVDANSTLTDVPYQLNSSEVKITSFCVSQSADAKSCVFDSTTGACALNAITPASNEIDVCISGQLQTGDVYTKTITRAFVQPIFVRSSAVGS